MDSVIGTVGGKVLLTIHFPHPSFMMGFLRDFNTSQSVIDIFEMLYVKLGRKLFEKIFPVILTFDNLTQEKIDIMMNHINSYSRLKLGNKTPFEAFDFYYGSELFEKLGYKQVEKNQVIINPKLLKR